MMRTPNVITTMRTSTRLVLWREHNKGVGDVCSSESGTIPQGRQRGYQQGADAKADCYVDANMGIH